MKVLYSQQLIDNMIQNFKYSFRDDGVVKIETYEVTNKEDILKDISYYDLSDLKVNTLYNTPAPFMNIFRNEDHLKVEVLVYISSKAKDKSNQGNMEWQDVIYENFVIPEDAEIIELEELVIPDFEEPVDPLVELAKANNRIAELETYVNNSKLENEALVLSAIEMMTEMMMG